MYQKIISLVFVMVLGAALATTVQAKQDMVYPKVRVIHASPDAPPVDVLADNNKIISKAPYLGVTDYLMVNPNQVYNIKVVPYDRAEPVVIEADLDFKRVKDYTVVAVGKLAEIEPIVFEDRRYGLPLTQAMVRFAHVSADAPAVDITLRDGTIVFSSVGFKESTEYAKLKPGAYDLQVRLAGTNDVVLDVPNVMVEAGKAYTVFAVGLVSEGTLQAMPVVDRDDSHRTWLLRNS